MRIEPSDVDRVRRIYDRIARRYDRIMAVVDALLFSGGRSWVATRAEGCVFEVAVGTGRNLPLYPPATRIVGVDLSPAILALAQQRSESLPLYVDLHVGDAQRLALSDASFDTVVQKSPPERNSSAPLTGLAAERPVRRRRRLA